MVHYPNEIEYSDKYEDESYEYRHVLLPKEVYKKMPRSRLLQENVLILIYSGMEKPWCTTIERLGSL